MEPLPENTSPKKQPISLSTYLRWVGIILASGLLAILVYGLVTKYQPVHSYEECVQKKGTIELTYPPVCVARNGQRFVQSVSVPTPTPNNITDTSSWKTYTNEEVTFNYPSSREEKPRTLQGSGFTQIIIDKSGLYTITIVYRGNYNQVTGRPYDSLDEYVGLPYQVKALQVDGQDARQPLPRAGSENVNKVIFFSKDNQFIYELSLQSNNSSMNVSAEEIEQGKSYFNQLLSTFHFLSDTTPIISPTISDQDMTKFENLCPSLGGTYLPDYKECEGITQRQCSQLFGGTFKECTSACRHDPNYPNVNCIESCIPVCSF